MNYRIEHERSSVSFYLQTELKRLQALSDEIRASGTVAPANCWLTETEQRKGNKTYRYVMLRSESSSVQARSLGRPASIAAKDWKRRTNRRDMISEVEQQMKLLTELIDRQMTHPIEFEYDNE